MLIPNVLCCLILWDTSYKCLLWQKLILWHIFPYIYGTILDRKYSKSSKNMHNAFLEIYHSIFYRALIEGVLSKDLVYNWLYTKYKNIEFLTLFEYHGTWELTVVWRLISCHLHQNPGKEYIYDIPCWVSNGTVGPARLYTTSGSFFQAAPKSFQFKLWSTWSQRSLKTD